MTDDAIYLDHNATTPLAPQVLAAMLPWLERDFGNASSRHRFGRAARQAVDVARQQVAAAVNAHPTEVIFTSGGSEANNLLLKGVAAGFKPGLLACGAAEHPCVLRPAAQLQRQGWQLRLVAVDTSGCLDLNDYTDTLLQKPSMVSLMAANNETGVINDIPALATAARQVGAVFHSDAVQLFGKARLDFRAWHHAGVQAITVSAHKAYGPKGIAALVLDKRLDVQPLIAGGGHERGLRSGTENVAAIVGFGVAAELADKAVSSQSSRMSALQLELEAGLLALGAQIFAVDAPRLPNTTFFAFPNVDGETLVGRLDEAGYALASGAACSSSNPEISHVLQAMKVAPEIARGAVRLSLGQGNTHEHIRSFLKTLQATVLGLQRLTALVH